VLNLRIPKAEEARPRRIDISVGWSISGRRLASQCWRGFWDL